MHTIKSAARKQAWYRSDEDGTPATYNPFGRPNRRRVRSIRDEEQGTTRLGHVQTESDARSPIEQTRQDEWRNPGDINGVKKSGTFNGVPSDNLAHQSGSRSIDGKEDAKTPTDEVPTTQTTGFTDGSNTAPRKRKIHIPFFGDKGSDVSDSTLVSPQTELQTRKSSQNKHGKKGPSTSIVQQLRIVFASWINILLVFVPVGLAFQYAKLNGTATFIFNFLAIIPLASMLSFATEEVALYVGETLGGLLNASFGNATELIVSIIALTQYKITIVQTSLIGSILSNLLLVLGMCFFLGGVNRLEQHFNVTVAQTAASLLALALGGLITPTAYRIFADDDSGVTPTSRATAVLLLWTYLCYLLFQLRTHTEMYNAPSKKVDKQNLLKKKTPAEADISKTVVPNAAQTAAVADSSVNKESIVNQEKSSEDPAEDDDTEEDDPQLGLVMSLCVLAGATALIAVTSDGMVSAIDAVTKPNGPLSEEFVGLILVPIVGNAAEHATAVTVAIKDKVDLAIGVAIGSSLQIALLVIPFLILLNWFGVGSPSVLNLNFDGFQIVVLFIAIILVNYVVQDGRSNWLEGMQLFIVYFIFAVAAWYYPADTPPE